MKIKYLIIHESAGPSGDVDLMERVHKARWRKNPSKWRVARAGQYRYCGYQKVLCLDGTIQQGRLDSEVGCHCIGYNSISLGICIIGETHLRPMAPAQWVSLLDACVRLCRRYSIPAANLLGHCETASGKAEGKLCPGKYTDINKLRQIVATALSEE